jgi:toxin-antitoxin system PIN domain toxin
MKRRLLDVNVLLALAWPAHEFHVRVQAWFQDIRSSGFATCPLTQSGFVRISCNPHFSPQAVSPPVALLLIDEITALPEHEFWPDALSLREAIPPHHPLRGHRQITDAYLAALAASRGGVVSTLDRAMLTLAESSVRVEWIMAQSPEP